MKNELKDVPIVGVSAFIGKQDIDDCKNAGMNDYVNKPFTHEKMQEVLINWMRFKYTVSS